MQTQKGVSLLSILVSLVVLSLVAVGVTQWWLYGFQGYRQGQDRFATQLHWRFAEKRLSKELQHAVPNSVSISDDGQALSYFPIAFSGKYRQNDLTDLDGLDVNWTASPFKHQDHPNLSIRIGIALKTSKEALSPNYSTWVRQSTANRVNFAALTSFARRSPRSVFYGYQQKIVWRLQGANLWRETWDLQGQRLSKQKMGVDVSAGSFFGFSPLSLANVTQIEWLWRWQGHHHRGVSQRQVQVLNVE